MVLVNWMKSQPSIPWALEMKAVSREKPSRLVESLTDEITECGGRVLCRGADPAGKINFLFEFERQSCLDIYCALVAAGVELNQSGHFRLTELYQCTRRQRRKRGAEIASLDLEIQTFSTENGREFIQPPAG